jgi:hypothetical protein
MTNASQRRQDRMGSNNPLGFTSQPIPTELVNNNNNNNNIASVETTNATIAEQSRILSETEFTGLFQKVFYFFMN